MCGGMLFRCRSCEYSFCEDCIPNHEANEGKPGQEIQYIGYTLPEMLELSYGENSMVYWIKCCSCVNEGRVDFLQFDDEEEEK